VVNVGDETSEYQKRKRETGRRCYHTAINTDKQEGGRHALQQGHYWNAHTDTKDDQRPCKNSTRVPPPGFFFIFFMTYASTTTTKPNTNARLHYTTVPLSRHVVVLHNINNNSNTRWLVPSTTTHCFRKQHDTELF
jgi:hypothetical protein